MVGGLVLWRTYAMSKRTAFLQPQRMHQLMVITKTGIPVYSFNFREEETGTDSILLSGGLTAIKALLKEAIGAASEIAAIKFKKKEIMVQSHDDFGVFLIVDRPSNFLRKAMEIFGKRFSQEFQIDESGLVDETAFKGADDFIKTVFGLN